MLAACQPEDGERAAINEIQAADAVRHDAEVRAERLSEVADEFAVGANRIGASPGKARRDRAAADRQAADKILKQGDAEAERMDQNVAGKLLP
ncbi:hypothetical protein LK533_15040 [Sphingomonas sp. PL-96]|nr:hypothetical protein [Sphingomonas sp. PL-96]